MIYDVENNCFLCDMKRNCIAGLRVTYDLHRPNGNRVHEIQVATCYKCQDYRPIEMDQSYKVVLMKYMARGGDGYDMIANFTIKQFNLGQFNNQTVQSRSGRLVNILI